MNKLLFFLLNSGGSGQQSFDLQKFSVKYNTTDFSYITSTSFSDAPTVPLASKTISRTTIAPDGAANANAVAGCSYIHSENGDNDRIVVHEIDGTIASFFPANDMQQASRLFTVTGSRQGISIDPINQYIFIYNNAGTITVKDFNSNTITTYTAPTHTTDVIMYYDWTVPGTWYAAREVATPGAVERWTLSGTTVSIAETYWYKGTDGVCKSNLTGNLINFDDSGPSARIRYQTLDGKDEIFLSQVPFSFVTEGLVEYPDGTIGMADPAGYSLHGSVVGGNTWIIQDPKGLYRKYNRAPGMDRFTKFKGGTVSGQFDNQIITATQPILSCVYDFGANTNQQNLSAWEAVVSSGGTYTLRFRGSNSAPSTTSTTNYLTTVPTYDANQSNDGWGSTTPGAWQSTPTSHRYMQAEITLASETPSTDITIQDLIDQIGSKLKILSIVGKDDKQYILYDSTSPTNQIKLAVNQAVPSNWWDNPTSSQRIQWNVAGYADDASANNHWLLQTPSAITGDTQGQFTIKGNRKVTTTRAIFLAGSTNNTNLHQLRFYHNASSDTPASQVGIAHVDGSGAVVNRVGYTDTGTTRARFDFISDGSTWTIKKNGVAQSLTVTTGSNNGNWFGDLGVAPNRVTTGFMLATSGLSGTHEMTFLMYCSSPTTAEDDALINAYLTQEGL